MKRILLTAIAVIGIAVSPVFAQMAGHQHQGGMMGGEGHDRMMGNQEMTDHQVMSEGMMHDLSKMMNQMDDMIVKMSHSMSHGNTMNKERMRDMSKMMNDLSITMKEMSDQIAKGTMDSGAMKKMQERMKKMDTRLSRMEEENHHQE